jgi:hypothetical protein
MQTALGIFLPSLLLLAVGCWHEGVQGSSETVETMQVLEVGVMVAVDVLYTLVQTRVHNH